MTIELAHRDFGPADAAAASRPPVVILHGLLGSSRNWAAAGRELARHFSVTALDLRNHGDSPHAPTAEIDEMAADVLGWLERHSVPRPLLIGHSLGGKIAMQIACRSPERLFAPIVVDIAPRPYPPGSVAIQAMRAVELYRASSRRDVDAQLAFHIPDAATRAFLLTNLVQDGEGGGYRWRVGLEGLHASVAGLRGSPLDHDERYDGEALFLVGGRSEYFAESDRAVVAHHFPRATIEVFPDAGHNVHFDARDDFVRAVVDWALPRLA